MTASPMQTVFPLPRGGTSRCLAVRLSEKGLRSIRRRHPWIFADSIEKLAPDAAPGDVAVVYDGKKIIGAGIADPDSNVRVRLLSFGASREKVGPELFRRLAGTAAERRTEAGVPGPETDAWRLLNGESDGFPGLVADQYADVLVLKIYTSAFLPHVGDVADALFARYPALKRLALRFSRELSAMSAERRLRLADGMLFPCEPEWNGEVVFRENGLRFLADVRSGQKTGFFLDQRENRARAGALAAGTDSVLNVFSYSGGFSLYAARSGAKRVTDIDFSRQAIAASMRNFELNREIPAVARCRHRGIADDAFHAMGELERAGERFSVVIVDPPSFAKSASERSQALKSYSRLAKSAVRLLERNGILVFASCSSRVGADELFEEVHRAAADAGRPLTEFDRRAEAPDHPALFPESHYLKCLYARVP